MIHQSRRWRMVIRVVALIVTSVLMLTFAGPVSYALQDDSPKQVITQTAQLLNKKEPVTDSFVYVVGAPESSRTLSIEDGSNTYYWVPLEGYDGQLFVRTKDYMYALQSDAEAIGSPSRGLSYVGKITSFGGQSGAEKVIKEMAARGITVDKEHAMVLLQGEQPSTYRPIVPVMPVLAWIWLVALVGLVQIVKGRRPRGTLSQSAVAARHVR